MNLEQAREVPHLLRHGYVNLEMLTRAADTIDRLVAEVERLKVLARDAFTEGYFSCTTYNDVETSDCDTQWEKSDVAAKVKGSV